jgi:phenylalanyl-tRNA synthetase beta chain
MKAPLSWLRDFVEIDLSLAELARLLTMAGLEVEGIHMLGLPMPAAGTVDAHLSGLEWDREKIVTASILEVLPHPNADRLILCRLLDGKQEHLVLTGAPNLFSYKGIGSLTKPLKVAFAKEGAQIYDGHQEGFVLTRLKRATIRGVESYSMVCSEKELGISEEHEGILLLDENTPVGLPLADVLGDAVLDVKLLPSFARCASIQGLAREIAALNGKRLKSLNNKSQIAAERTHKPGDFAKIEITDPRMNPRFVLGIIRGVEIRPSPARVQQRLKLAGMRPINNVVDATNYVMLETGEPLHAFDHDVLLKRSGGKKVKIITRAAKPDEKLVTLDGVERSLDAGTILVCDEAGALSMAGVMGGQESEISDSTRNILLEGAAWNFINIRRTSQKYGLQSEASYRFARGVHPAMAERGVRRGLELMATWASGKANPGLVDAYPLPYVDPTIEISAADVKRWLGVQVPIRQMKSMLERLEFKCIVQGRQSMLVTAPDHRIDIGEGISGKADVVEEIARLFGYDNIPPARLADKLPHQIGNQRLEKEERIRDLLVALGLQETISYRLTKPEGERRRLSPGSPPDDRPYLHLTNPISPEKAVMRHSVLASVLEIGERNSRNSNRLAFFEIGPVFLASEEPGLPDEQQRLAILLSGVRSLPGWQPSDPGPLDFYDLKGMLTALFRGMRICPVSFEPTEHPSFHPGKCAKVNSDGKQLGVFGEIHPQVRGQYDWPVSFRSAIMAADLDLDTMLALMPTLTQTENVPSLPAVLEDLAIVVDENIPAERVVQVIRQAGGKVVTQVHLFDVYRDEKVGAGKKSLAYNLTYQATGKTFTDKDIAGMRARILRRLEQEIGAQLRS